MENNRWANRAGRAGLGPAPARARHERLSPSRAELLESVRAQAEPTTLAALAQATGRHPNTVREHLEALERQGLVTRVAATPSGRGRPAWLYQATDADPDASNEYAGLASALAASIHRTSSDPVRDASDAGLDWGRDLARRRGARPAPEPQEARREVVALLDDLGFAPETDRSAEDVRLTRCPLLEAAHRYPDVVCAVHLGLARGALEEYGADADGAELVPFAEPGACRLRLAR